MSREIPLNEMGMTVLTSGGAYGQGYYGQGVYGGAPPYAVVQLGPAAARVFWEPSSIIISTPSLSIPLFYLYRNGMQQINLIGSSISGNADMVPFDGPPLSPGEFLVGQWVGGDQGVQASMNVVGTKRVPGRDM